MANQSPDRREALQLLAKVAIAGQFPGFARWVYAGSPQAPPLHTPQRTPLHTPEARPYLPRFFTPEEYAAIDRLTELIIPAENLNGRYEAGAHEAGVAEFVDFMTAADASLQPRARDGVRSLDAQARLRHGTAFLALPEDAQVALLQSISGQPFFDFLRTYTVMGFYTSRIGLEQLDYPGLKMYGASPACPHHDDPEHRHLLPAAL